MSQNLIIDGIVLNGVDSLSIPNENGERITYIEKTNVGTGVPVAQIGERQLYTVEDALAAAAPGETITMIADATENAGLTIPAGVTLDLQGHTLTAHRVVGLNGSFITATPNSGKLLVPQGNLVLSEQGWRNEKGQYVMPIWDPVNGYYLFSLFVVNTATTARGLYISEETGELYFQFKPQATTAILKGLLADGASDNELKIKVVVEWTDAAGVNTMAVAYSDNKVAAATGAQDLSCRINYGSLGINIDTLTVYGAIVTNSGATAFGDKWTLENAKQL